MMSVDDDNGDDPWNDGPADTSTHWDGVIFW